jgi:hypothetical protein
MPGMPSVRTTFAPTPRAAELVDEADALVPVSDAAGRALVGAARAAADEAAAVAAAATAAANGSGEGAVRRASWQSGALGASGASGARCAR